MKQKYPIKLIDTDKPSNLFYYKNALCSLDEPCKQDHDSQNKLLVVLSDDEIKEGWVLNEENDLEHLTKFSPVRPSDKKIIASNSKELTPNSLILDSYIETYAKQFNAGNAPEWIELEMEVQIGVSCELKDIGTKDWYGVRIPKTSNNYVIVAGKGETIIKEDMKLEKAYPDKTESIKRSARMGSKFIDTQLPDVKTYTKEEVVALLYALPDNLSEKDFNDFLTKNLK